MATQSSAIRTIRHEFRLPYVTIELIEAEKIDHAPVLDEGENVYPSIGAKISSEGTFSSSWRYLGPAGAINRPCDFASFAPARVPWGTIVSGGGRARGLACRFEEDYFLATTGLDVSWSIKQLRACQDLNSVNIRRTLNQIYSELCHPGFSSRDLVEALCKVMLIELARHFKNLRYEDNEGEAYFSKSNIMFLEEMVKNHECGKIKIKDLADFFCMSEGYFHTRFKTETGLTPNQFIERVRIERAVELLSDRNNSIKQIAYTLGFSCQSSFSVAFRRATGETPGRFRRTAFSGDAI